MPLPRPCQETPGGEVPRGGCARPRSARTAAPNGEGSRDGKPLGELACMAAGRADTTAPEGLSAG